SMPISSIAATAKGSSSPFCTPAEPTRTAVPYNCCSRPAAIGERKEFIPHANKTAFGRGGRSAIAASALPVQHADQRKQPARGIKIDRHLALQPLHQDVRAVVVNSAPPHVDRLNLVRRRGANGLIIAVADQVVVLDDAAQRRERKEVRDNGGTILAADI